MTCLEIVVARKDFSCLLRYQFDIPHMHEEWVGQCGLNRLYPVQQEIWNRKIMV